MFNNNKIIKFVIAFIVLFFLVRTCNNIFSSSSNNYTSSKSWEKTPVDKLIAAMPSEKNYSIILSDMDERQGKYLHKYRVLRERPDTVLLEESDWLNVPDRFFKSNLDNLGMEIASMKDGKLSKKANPAGYNHYVGNEKYGHWENNSSGGSFWSFYGKYAFMSSMFNMLSPAPRSYWNDYNRRSYGSRSYYGPSGTSAYGTKAYTSSSVGKSSSWASKPSSFRNSVRSKVSRSVGSTSSRKYSSGSSYSKSNSSARRSRSSSRYSRSSSRSRSGGFGK